MATITDRQRVPLRRDGTPNDDVTLDPGAVTLDRCIKNEPPKGKEDISTPNKGVSLAHFGRPYNGARSPPVSEARPESGRRPGRCGQGDI